MRLALLLVLAFAPAVEEPATVQETEADKPRLEVTGCVKRSILRETTLGAGETSFHVARRWRVRGSKPLMRRIKDHDGQELVIVGTTKNPESNAGGRRIGRMPIYIGGTPNDNSRDPLPELPTIDVQTVEPTGNPCRTK